MICFTSPLHSFQKRNSSAYDYLKRAGPNLRCARRASFQNIIMCLTTGDILRMKRAELHELYSHAIVPSRDSFTGGEYSGTMILPTFISWLIKALIWSGKRYIPEEKAFINKWGPFGKVAAIKLTPRFSSHCVHLNYSDALPYPASLVRDQVRTIATGKYLGIMYFNRTKLAYFLLESSRRPS